MPSPTARKLPLSRVTLSVIVNGFVVPRIASSPFTSQVACLSDPEQVDVCDEKRRSGSWPSAVVNTCFRMCSSRRPIPVLRVFTGTLASSRWIWKPFAPSRTVARPSSAADLPWMPIAETFVAASNAAVPPRTSTDVPSDSANAAVAERTVIDKPSATLQFRQVCCFIVVSPLHTVVAADCVKAWPHRTPYEYGVDMTEQA